MNAYFVLLVVISRRSHDLGQPARLRPPPKGPRRAAAAKRLPTAFRCVAAARPQYRAAVPCALAALN